MREIDILLDNSSGQNKSIVMIRFLNMIKERKLFGTDTLNFHIKGHKKNNCDCEFYRLKVL